MPEMRRVIVELRYSAGRRDLARDVASGETRPHVTADVVPSIAGLEIDPTYPPVELPALVAASSRGPRDVTEGLALDTDETHATYLVRATVSEDDLDATVAAADSNQAVVGLFADVAVQPCLICPGDPAAGDDSDVERLLCADRLRDCGMDGSGVLVAVVDTGINMAYLNARGKNPGFDAARSWTPVAGLTPGDLPVDHGTMCAFDVCIAAPKCTLLDIALLQSTTPGRTIMEGFLSDAVLAYRHLLDVMTAPQRPGECRSMVVNNSWGMFHPSWDFPVGHPGNYSDNADHPFNRIVASLDLAGADILFAAGNCGPDCPDGRCRGVTSNAIYGANSHPQVLSVAGVDTTKTRVGYSSVGPGRLTKQKPDLAGYTHFKGSGVYPADGGTSAATPVVAGVVAALRSRIPHQASRPETSPAAVRNLLVKTAEDAGLTGYDFEYGWGIVNGCALAAAHCGDRECPCPDRPCRTCCCCCCCCRCRRCGCETELPDLVPVPEGDSGFCRRRDGTLLVRICNQGNGPAGPSTTTVDFGSHGAVDVATPALAAGACVDLSVQIPPGCFDPDCEFRITADSRGVVSESNETNNTASGSCLG